MRIGVIDLGTNSVRFDVHELGKGRASERLHREKIMVRLGQGVFLRGALDPHAIRRTIHAFVQFKKIASRLRADKIVAFGTSALREADDREKLLTLVRDRSRIDVRVISGEEEARLIALGILSNERVGHGRFGLLDIGGGSTEVSICRGKKALHSFSFPLGTARLQQVFLKKSPPDAESVDELRAYVRTTLQQKRDTDEWPKVTRIIGSSGTVRAVSRILRKSGWMSRAADNSIHREDLHALVLKLSRMTSDQILKIPGMEPKRVDMILAGSILLEEAMRVLGAQKVDPTDFSLRDGILEEERQVLASHGKSQISLHLPDLAAAAERFGGDREHALAVASLAATLFDRLRAVHRLKPSWRPYLEAAAVLKNTGEAVTLVDPEIHSHYIVGHMDFPARENWEQKFVADLCLHVRTSKLEKKDIPFKRDPEKAQAFCRLLPILQLVDALDGGRESRPKLSRVRVGRKAVQVLCAPRGATGLESLNVELRKGLFEKTFRRTLSADSD